MMKVTFAGVVAALLSLATAFVATVVFATSPLPPSIRHYAPYALPAFGVLVCLSIWIAIAGLEPASGTVQNGADYHVDVPCPNRTCPFPVVGVHGRQGDKVFLECATCHSSMKATYENGTLAKLFIVGVGTLVGVEEIARYLSGDAGVLTDAFGQILDSLSG